MAEEEMSPVRRRGGGVGLLEVDVLGLDYGDARQRQASMAVHQSVVSG